MRENTDIQPSLTPDLLPGRYSSGLDGLRANVARLHCLQPELAKNNTIPTSRVTFDPTPLTFSELDPFWHQRHRQSPHPNNHPD